MVEAIKTGKRMAANHSRQSQEHRNWLVGPTPVEAGRVVPKLALGDTAGLRVSAATSRAGYALKPRGQDNAVQSARTTLWNEWNGDTDVPAWKEELDTHVANRSSTRIWGLTARQTYPQHSEVLRSDRERHRVYGMSGPPHNEDRLMLHHVGHERAEFATFERVILRSAKPKDNRFRTSVDPTLLGLQDPAPVRGRGGNGRHLVSSIRPFGDSAPESTNPLLPLKPKPPPPRCSYDPVTHAFVPEKSAVTCPYQDPMHVKAHLDLGDERLPSGRLRARYHAHGDGKARASTIKAVLAHPQSFPHE